jgi:ATP-dependent RNA helicase SUPV3L1/SUV3
MLKLNYINLVTLIFLLQQTQLEWEINMDIDHISFNNLNKFDGRRNRHLRLTEIGQIAGRAGRYMNDGTFGITGKCDELSPEQNRQIRKS